MAKRNKTISINNDNIEAPIPYTIIQGTPTVHRKVATDPNSPLLGADDWNDYHLQNPYSIVWLNSTSISPATVYNWVDPAVSKPQIYVGSIAIAGTPVGSQTTSPNIPDISTFNAWVCTGYSPIVDPDTGAILNARIVWSYINNLNSTPSNTLLVAFDGSNAQSVQEINLQGNLISNSTITNDTGIPILNLVDFAPLTGVTPPDRYTQNTPANVSRFKPGIYYRDTQRGVLYILQEVDPAPNNLLFLRWEAINAQSISFIDNTSGGLGTALAKRVIFRENTYASYDTTTDFLTLRPRQSITYRDLQGNTSTDVFDQVLYNAQDFYAVSTSDVSNYKKLEIFNNRNVVLRSTLISYGYNIFPPVFISPSDNINLKIDVGTLIIDDTIKRNSAYLLKSRPTLEVLTAIQLSPINQINLSYKSVYINVIYNSQTPLLDTSTPPRLVTYDENLRYDFSIGSIYVDDSFRPGSFYSGSFYSNSFYTTSTLVTLNNAWYIVNITQNLPDYSLNIFYEAFCVDTSTVPNYGLTIVKNTRVNDAYSNTPVLSITGKPQLTASNYTTPTNVFDTVTLGTGLTSTLAGNNLTINASNQAIGLGFIIPMGLSVNSGAVTSPQPFTMPVLLDTPALLGSVTFSVSFNSTDPTTVTEQFVNAYNAALNPTTPITNAIKNQTVTLYLSNPLFFFLSTGVPTTATFTPTNQQIATAFTKSYPPPAVVQVAGVSFDMSPNDPYFYRRGSPTASNIVSSLNRLIGDVSINNLDSNIRLTVDELSNVISINLADFIVTKAQKTIEYIFSATQTINYGVGAILKNWVILGAGTPTPDLSYNSSTGVFTCQAPTTNNTRTFIINCTVCFPATISGSVVNTTGVRFLYFVKGSTDSGTSRFAAQLTSPTATSIGVNGTFLNVAGTVRLANAETFTIWAYFDTNPAVTSSTMTIGNADSGFQQFYTTRLQITQIN